MDLYKHYYKENLIMVNKINKVVKKKYDKKIFDIIEPLIFGCIP